MKFNWRRMGQEVRIRMTKLLTKILTTVIIVIALIITVEVRETAMAPATGRGILMNRLLIMSTCGLQIQKLKRKLIKNGLQQRRITIRYIVSIGIILTSGRNHVITNVLMSGIKVNTGGFFYAYHPYDKPEDDPLFIEYDSNGNPVYTNDHAIISNLFEWVPCEPYEKTETREVTVTTITCSICGAVK